MKKMVFGFLIPLLLPVYMFAQECPPVHAHQRDLVILPDTAGEELIEVLGRNAVNEFQTEHLRTVLVAQAVPVLVELSIWKRFIKKMKLQAKIGFDNAAFDFYKFDNFLLCIPKKWHQQFPDTGFNLAQFIPIEDSLAIAPTFLDPIKGTVKTLLTLVNVYGSLVKVLRTLLVVPDKTHYAWNVVLFGHGGPGIRLYKAQVGGIPFEEFKKLLKFLEHEITTNTFLYSTCYAGSEWLLKAYQTKGKPDLYHFTIIITGITEAPVYFWPEYHKTSVYENFFQKIKTVAICKKNIAEIGWIAGILLQSLIFKKKEQKVYMTAVNNVLQIRWPNESQFHVIELDKLVKSSQVLKKESKKEADTPLTTNALIMNTPYLNRNLILTETYHAIASSIAAKWHYIRSIVLKSQPQLLMGIFLNLFISTRELESPKVFLIDKVTNSDGSQMAEKVMVFINSGTPSTYPLQKTTEVFYLIANQGYRLGILGLDPVVLTPRVTNRYVKLYEKEKNKLLVQKKKSTEKVIP